MTNAKTKPAIRFGGFTGAWEQCKLREVAKFCKGHGYSKNDLQEIGTPIILYGRMYTRYETLITNVDTFVMALPDSIYSTGKEVIVPASGETAEDIAIASSVEKSGILLGGDLNIIYPDEKIDPVFLALSISNGKPKKEMAKRSQGKSIVHLHNSDLQDIILPYPKNDEQRQISSFFLHLDHLITLHQRKCDKMKTVKKSMLEKMFPKPGATTPEIRFSGFTGAWEQRKLGECFGERQERSAEGELISVTINEGIKKFSDLGRHDSSSDDKSNYKVVVAGDIAYNSMRMWQGASGFSQYTGILSPAYTVLVPKSGVDSRFFSYVFKKSEMIHRFQISSQGITSDTWNLKYPALSEIEVSLPNIIEQQQIAECFTHLDHLITLHQRKLETLKNIKKACLERMFV